MEVWLLTSNGGEWSHTGSSWSQLLASVWHRKSLCPRCLSRPFTRTDYSSQAETPGTSLFAGFNIAVVIYCFQMRNCITNMTNNDEHAIEIMLKECTVHYIYLSVSRIICFTGTVFIETL